MWRKGLCTFLVLATQPRALCVVLFWYLVGNFEINCFSVHLLLAKGSEYTCMVTTVTTKTLCSSDCECAALQRPPPPTPCSGCGPHPLPSSPTPRRAQQCSALWWMILSEQGNSFSFTGAWVIVTYMVMGIHY